MEIPIIIKTEVKCPALGVNILLIVCRGCPKYRYETVDGKVICDYDPKDKKGFGIYG